MALNRIPGALHDGRAMIPGYFASQSLSSWWGRVPCILNRKTPPGQRPALEKTVPTWLYRLSLETQTCGIGSRLSVNIIRILALA